MEQLELQPPGVPANDVITHQRVVPMTGTSISRSTADRTSGPLRIGTTTAAIGYQFDGTRRFATTTNVPAIMSCALVNADQ